MSHESPAPVGVSASQVHGIGGARRYDEGYNKAAPGGASTPLIQGPRRSIEEID